MNLHRQTRREVRVRHATAGVRHGVAARGARAQPSTMPVVGFVNGRTPEASGRIAGAFRKGLNEAGYVEGCLREGQIRQGCNMARRGLALSANSFASCIPSIGVSVTHVPFRAAVLAMQEVIAGRIDYLCPVAAIALPS
jgi:hypothetical protein